MQVPRPTELALSRIDFTAAQGERRYLRASACCELDAIRLEAIELQSTLTSSAPQAQKKPALGRLLRHAAGVIGGADGDRTHDLRIANATLSQLSYRPTLTRLHGSSRKAANGSVACGGCQDLTAGRGFRHRPCRRKACCGPRREAQRCHAAGLKRPFDQRC
jgi:hypothetical protein